MQDFTMVAGTNHGCSAEGLEMENAVVEMLQTSRRLRADRDESTFHELAVEYKPQACSSRASRRSTTDIGDPSSTRGVARNQATRGSREGEMKTCQAQRTTLL